MKAKQRVARQRTSKSAFCRIFSPCNMPAVAAVAAVAVVVVVAFALIAIAACGCRKSCNTYIMHTSKQINASSPKRWPLCRH